MKKNILSKIIGFAFCVLALTACGNNGTKVNDAEVNNQATEESGDKKLKFAFLTNTQNNTFQIAMNDVYEKLCKEKGIEYTMFDPDYDLNTQLNQINDAANQGYDAVFIIPVDSAGIRGGLEELNNKNVPVLNVDTAVIEQDRDLVQTIVATDAFMAGKLVAEELVKNNPDGAKIAILDFPENESCVQRVAGFMSVIENDSKYEIVAQQDGKAALDESLTKTEDIVQANQDLDAIFAINDPSALGAAAALQSSGLTGKIQVYSIDASPDGKAALLDGQFTAVSAQVPKQIAEKSVELALKILNGEKIEKENYLPSHNVTIEEAKETINDWQ